MSEIKTITATSTEQEITLDATYQFVWFRNLGDNDCYVSDHSGIIAGADDVALCKAGECVRITLPQAPMSNKAYIKAVDGSNTVEIHAQNFSDKPTAKTGKGSGGGQSITVEPLTVTDNGVYTAPTGKAYSPVTVDVKEQPWQPLQDGYSNFWFELTNDTLSPWLNLSAKTENAVIDWGDGSGEQALTTLTPTHTYSKAGRYVVKVKGVTGIAAQHAGQLSSGYFNVLRYVELNNEIVNYNEYAFGYCIQLKRLHAKFIAYAEGIFRYCGALEAVEADTASGNFLSNAFNFCSNLKSFPVPSNTTNVGSSSISYCFSLTSIVLPSTVTNFGNSCFNASINLSEIHVQSTTPPTLGTNIFAALPTNYVIYVPIGTLSAYQTAWSTYADHILEEGQTPNRMMLAKFNSEKTDEPQDDMR